MTIHSIRLDHDSPLEGTVLSVQARFMNADSSCGGHSLTDVQRVRIAKLSTTRQITAIRNEILRITRKTGRSVRKPAHR